MFTKRHGKSLDLLWVKPMLKAACLLALIPTQAFALSCAPANFGSEFNRIAEAKELYWIGYGELRMTGPLPETRRGQPYSAEYEFIGRINFSRNKVAHDVTMESTCTGTWCGNMPKEQVPVIVFMEHRNDELFLSSRPCNADFLTEPSLGEVGALRACLKKGKCHEKEISAFE